MKETTPGPVVLGGGVAGIAAAVTLSLAGLRPTLLEARTYLGGRARSFRHPGTGDEIDSGQHLMMGCYHATNRLLEQLGTRGLLRMQDRLDVSFRDADGRADRLLASAHLPAPLNVVVGMMRLRRLGAIDRLRLLNMARLVRFGGAQPGESVAEFLKRARQTTASIRRLWEPITLATLNAAPDRAPASTFVEVMRRAFLGGPLDSRLVIPTVPLSDLFEPARALIESSGGRVIHGAIVQQVLPARGGVSVFSRDRESMDTDAVVCALPPRAAASVLATLHPPLVAWRDNRGSPIVSIYLWFDRSLAGMPELTAMIGTATQWVFNRRRMLRAPQATPGLLACTISAATGQAESSAEGLAQLCEREVRRAFREIPQEARLIDFVVLKERHATFLTEPDLESHRPTSETSVPGLVMAGDWTATGLPATIEGAVLSGTAAAGVVLRRR